MKPEQQIKTLAELDGWMKTFWDQNNYLWGVRNSRSYSEPTPSNLYLTSYDAIIPLIQRQDDETKQQFFYELMKIHGLKIEPVMSSPTSFQISITHLQFAKLITDSTPAQLCEALLRATVKWIE